MNPAMRIVGRVFVVAVNNKNCYYNDVCSVDEKGLVYLIIIYKAIVVQRL